MPNRTRPPFFIVGAPRSGTGLLRNLLRSHPHLAIPGESHFIPCLYLGYGEPRNRRAVRRMARWILAMYRIRRWEIDLGPDDFDGCRSYAELVSRVYEAFAANQGAERWGDKTPQYAAHLPVLAHIFPDAKFLHIIRDGRDMALSILRMGFGPGTVGGAARLWRELVTRARADGRRIGLDRYLEIRYEDLARNPATTMREVCEFLCEPFDERVLRPGPRDDYPTIVYNLPRDGRPRNVANDAVVDDHVGRWRRDMSAADRARFEAIAGALLGELGYEVALGGAADPVEPPGSLGSRLRELQHLVGQQLGRPNKAFWVPTEMRLMWSWARARFRRARRGIPGLQ